MADAALSATDAAAGAARPGPAFAAAVPALTGRLVIVVPYLWLLVFFLVPFIIVFKISLSQTAIAMPPYLPVLQPRGRLFRAARRSSASSSFDNYVWLTEDPLYFNAYVSSVVIAGGLDVPGAAGRLPDRLWHGARAGRRCGRRC